MSKHIAVAAGCTLLAGVLLEARQAPVFQKICPPCSAVASAQKDLGQIPADALRDRSWALGPKGINVPWTPGGDIAGRLPGTTATIVQIDTGVILHPLLAASTVDHHAADGLYGPGHANIDPLLGGFLRNPAHGTKTASVIVARSTAAMTGLFGAAPGAHLIPIRATEGVLLLDGPLGELNADQHRIARALNEAARGAAGMLRRKVDVVSMSLGGWPPDPALCEAVKNATDAKIIVIVAAGNKVKRTKYPAKCATAIAIGGSTYNETPWRDSAGSAEVVASAPAEGVWTATVMNGVPCMEASSGTSFATALVASMAAEWVARHRQAGTLAADPSAAFREALKQSVRRWSGPDAASWAQRFGPGIVDMTRLK